MKLNNFFKNKFNPEQHWFLIIIGFFTLLIIIALYSVYSFLYIQKQIDIINIEVSNNIQNSTSTETVEKNQKNDKFLKDINNLNNVLDQFNNKEIEYNSLKKTSISEVERSINIASSTVATSTNP